MHAGEIASVQLQAINEWDQLALAMQNQQQQRRPQQQQQRLASADEGPKVVELNFKALSISMAPKSKIVVPPCLGLMRSCTLVATTSVTVAPTKRTRKSPTESRLALHQTKKYFNL